MQQSNIIFFYLFAAFLIFITMRGELPIYMGFLLASPRGTGAVTGATPASDQSANAGKNFEAVANVATKAAMMF